MKPYVAAVVATFGRPREIERLLHSLAGVEAVFVCDNSGREEIRTAVEKSPLQAHYLAPGQNLGCGGGLRAAEERAWGECGDRLTHLLVLDDDAVLKEGTIPLMLEAMQREDAVAAYPLITGPEGQVGWTPGLRERRLHLLGAKRLSPAAYRQEFGRQTAVFEWAQGICLLARRDAVDRSGFHRSDFWVRGEDLDFSLRLTAQGRGIFAIAAEAQHLPPEATSTSTAAEYLRHAAMVQNIAFLAFNQSHGRSLRSSLPGSARRFLSLWGMRAIIDLLRAFTRGALRGEPAGSGQGATFQHRFRELAA